MILSAQKRDNKAYKVLLYPTLILLIIIGVVPIVAIIVVSMLDWNLASTATPSFVWFENFASMLKDKRFLNSLGIQALYSFLILTIQLSLGLVAALSLNKLPDRYRWLKGLTMAPLVVPPIVVALIWLTLYTPSISPINDTLEMIGLAGPEWLTTPFMALLSIVIADTWAGFPFVMIIVLAALQAIPNDIYEAATIDGAGRGRMFINITLPYIKTSLIMAGMFRLIESLKSFPLIFILTGGGPGTSTELTNFYAYLQGFEYSYISYASALAFVVFAFTMFVTYFISKSNEI